MTRKALGRGINALLSDTAGTRQEETQLELDIDLIEPNPAQPRTYFDETKLAELAQSIVANGIVQPILVRRHGGRYQIVAGERRWRAAQRAELTKIPAVVRDIPDDKLLELALIENIQRHELNAIEEAQAYKGLIDTLGLTQEMVAQRVGRDRTYVTNYVRLLRLPEDVQRFVEEDKISMGHARALLGVDDPDIQRRVAKNIIDFSLSVRDTERAIKRIVNGDSPATATLPPAKQKDANTRAAETKLRRRFGTQVRIVANRTGAGGKFEIEFYNDDDLQRLYEALMGQEAAAASSN
jgi:ParB family chromosome partitioning protein